VLAVVLALAQGQVALDGLDVVAFEIAQFQEAVEASGAGAGRRAGGRLEGGQGLEEGLAEQAAFGESAPGVVEVGGQGVSLEGYRVVEVEEGVADLFDEGLGRAAGEGVLGHGTSMRP